MEVKKILIANRGEIALRIIRAAKEMNMPTVAVFSEADRNALHVRMADEAVAIGPSPAVASYLNMEAIFKACEEVGAWGIHPGYGFLSENAHFAKLAREKGLVFIGPSPEAMEMLGSKIEAKMQAKLLNIPLVPGTETPITDLTEATRRAKEIGFPLLIKASAGGGGKGMRLVEDENIFEEQVALASREAKAAFGDGAVFLEKFIASPKHIEIQVLGDHFGNVVHLFERECSVQRRHQKVIEEAPSSAVSSERRSEMGQCAVAIAKQCGYYSAGTVEFIMDASGQFYFLEMNTRLQVEHPVTELVSGIDLVKAQIHIAMGEPLPFTQEDLAIRGHAIELRVYAEDPQNDFLPDVGVLQTYRLPSGPGVRVDNGYEENMEVPIYYDPMLAKLIAYGSDRKEAIQTMIRAIEEYRVTGVATTLSFGAFVMRHENFVSGKFDTGFVKNYYRPELEEASQRPIDVEAETAAWISAYFLEKEKASPNTRPSPNPSGNSRWKTNRKVNG